MSSSVAQDPRNDDKAALLQQIARMWREGHFADGLATVERLPDEWRREFQFMAYEAELRGRLGDHDREIETLDLLIGQQPGMASLWVSRGYALMMLGRRQESIDSYRQAIRLRSAYGKAWWGLSELRSYRFEEAEIASMEVVLSENPPAEDALHLHFALSAAFDQRGEPAKAIEHLRLANAIRSSAIPATAKTITVKVDRAIETFTSDLFAERSAHGCANEAPIFIVGLQRSGTSLIEQVLSSHPDVEGLGELPIVRQLIREHDGIEGIAALAPDRLAAIGEAYLDRARHFRRTSRPRFIDKLPNNWLHIGLIRLILPGAKIIDARRHPMATGFSNFQQNYGSGLAWSYDLASIGRYYRDYLRLMTHFERIQPGAMRRVVNERLIDDFEGEVRQLLDYLGLSFDPACLDFHKTERAVQTPSAEQVRRPVSREGVDRWRAYEPWLGELKAALGPALERWDLPPGKYVDEGEERG